MLKEPVMKELKTMYVEPTEKTPLIDLNYMSGELILSGKSIPINAPRIFEPVLDWVYEYIKSPRQTTNLRLNLEYFNTASSKIILDILTLLEEMIENGHKVRVRWYYVSDDEDMEEAGEDYAEMVDVPFELIQL